MRGILFLIFALTASLARATPSVDPGGIDDMRDYQVGSEWGKVPVTGELLSLSAPALKRAIYASAKISTGGTGFYLGKYAGLHVFVTNHHVCSMGAVCLDGFAEFSFLGIRAKLVQFLGTLASVDLTFLALELTAEEEMRLLPYARNFSFSHEITEREKLLTLGYGVAGNPSQMLTLNQDEDCEVFSGTGQYRLMSDPDTINPADYQAWSFAIGCDVSHGDSGSPLIDRESGEIVGILWTGKAPKSESVRNSSTIQSWIGTGNEAIWSELNYAVPAQKMRPEILNYINHYPWFTPGAKEALTALIQD